MNQSRSFSANNFWHSRYIEVKLMVEIAKIGSKGSSKLHYNWQLDICGTVVCTNIMASNGCLYDGHVSDIKQ